jgi:hypothetical protein
VLSRHREELHPTVSLIHDTNGVGVHGKAARSAELTGTGSFATNGSFDGPVRGDHEDASQRCVEEENVAVVCYEHCGRPSERG